MTVKLLTKHHLEFISLKGGRTGLSESTLVKMPHCWKSHVKAHMFWCRNKKIIYLVPTFNFLTEGLIMTLKMIFVRGVFYFRRGIFLLGHCK